MKRSVGFLVVLFGFLPLAVNAHAAAGPRPAQQSAWNQLLAANGNQLQVRWDEDLGCPASVMRLRSREERAALASQRISSSQALANAQQFFETNRVLFSLRAGIDEMSPVRTHELGGYQILRFSQLHRGVPVDGGGYTVTIEPDGAIGLLSGRVHPGLDVSVVPEAAESDARRSALAAAPPGGPREVRSASLVVLPTPSGGQLAWAVGVTSTLGGGEWRVLVSARDGRVIEVQDLLVHEQPEIQKAGTGDPSGHPATGPGARGLKPPASRNPFEYEGGGDEGSGGGPGGSSCPSPSGNVYATTSCAGSYIPSYLNRLTSYYNTIGTNVNVQPVPSRGDSRANDPNGCQQFLYTPPDPNGPGYDDSGFDDVNVYYHVDRALNDFWGSRFLYRHLPDGNGNATPVVAWTHIKQDTIVHLPDAHFDPATLQIYFGDGSHDPKFGPETYDFAKNSAIVYHELAHAVMYDLGLNAGGGATFLTRAVHEGMADYFAATFLNDAHIGACFYRACSGTSLRPLDSDPYVYNYNNVALVHTVCGTSSGINDPHVIGMIMSGAMWSIRGLMGASEADQMAYYAVDMSATNAQLLDIRDACYYYDTIYHFGDNHCALQNIFAQRGLDVMPTLPPAPGNVVATDGQCQITISWSAVNGASGYHVSQGANLLFSVDRLTTSVQILNGPTVPTLYTVKAFNCIGEGPGGSDYGSRAQPPPVPVSCAASDANVDCEVTVTWPDVTGETGYLIARDGVQVGTTGANVTTFHDTSAPQGVHNYAVASSGCGNSAYCPSDPGSRKPAPGGPGALTASDGVLDVVNLSWADVTGETGYHIYRGTTQIATLPANSVSYSDANPPYGVFQYCVKPYSCEGEGAGACDNGFRQPLPLVVTIFGPTTIGPNTVQQYSVTVTGGLGPYTYQWSKYRDCPGGVIPSPNLVQSISTDSRPQVQEATCWLWFPAGTGSAQAAQDVVDFRMRCDVTDGTGATGYAQRNVDVTGSIGSPQDPVSSVAATDGDATVNKVKITWGSSDGAEGYRVYRNGVLIQTLTQTFRSYVDPTAPNAVTTYCVAAYSGGNTSSQVCDTGYPYVPFAASVSGPSTLNYNASGTYTVSVTGGIAPLSYQWYKATWCPDVDPAPNALQYGTQALKHAGSTSAGPGDEINVPPCNIFYPLSGQTGTSVNMPGTYDFTIRCRVEDAVGRVLTPQENVDVLGVDPPVPGPSSATQASIEAAAPARTELLGMRPNPAQGFAEVGFSLARGSHVILEVIDIAGRTVAKLEDGWREAGNHRVSWNTRSVTPGVYMYRMRVGDLTTTKRVAVIR